MAWDEALLESVNGLGAPVLRFYSWTEPAATFGFFQHHATVAALTPLRPLIRRPTGGGLVPHDADWTYSLVFPAGHEWHRLRAPASYQRVHEWIGAAFSALGVATELSPMPRPDAPGQCFLGAERHDLLWRDRKIAGAAQRRNQSGLLIQGSVQPPPGSERSAWEDALLRIAQTQWHVNGRDLFPSPALRRRAQQLAAEKYSQPAHNERR
jgi:lipoate-protein ligase A